MLCLFFCRCLVDIGLKIVVLNDATKVLSLLLFESQFTIEFAYRQYQIIISILPELRLEPIIVHNISM